MEAKTAKIHKSANRKLAIESGHFMKPKHTVMKDKNVYSRKPKHKI